MSIICHLLEGLRRQMEAGQFDGEKQFRQDRGGGCRDEGKRKHKILKE